MLPMKRSRSSNDVLNPSPKSPASDGASLRPDPRGFPSSQHQEAADLPVAEIFGASSTEAGKGNGHEQIGNFLDNCFFCKKRLKLRDEVFMSGYLRAFCTPECRNKQLAIDKETETETAAKQARGKRSAECSRNTSVEGSVKFLSGKACSCAVLYTLALMVSTAVHGSSGF